MRKRDPNVLAFVMAGGEGTRLRPLTTSLCKPSMPFSGSHRLVDFVLSNLVNSGICSIYLLVQYRSQTLIEHVRSAWAMSPAIRGHFVTAVPPQMHNGRERFGGTADAVAQNLHLIETHRPDLVAVFGADHIYRMDVRQMVDQHLARGAEVSVSAVPVPVGNCASLGIVEADEDLWVKEFHEKPKHAPASMVGRRGYAFASMGNYLFSADVLIEELRRCRSDAEHDFGHHVLPRIVKSRKVLAYDFTANSVPGVAEFEEANYWRDVGTIDSYFDAHFDSLGVRPKFRLSNAEWPIHASPQPYESAQIESAVVSESVVGSGCVLRHARLERSMLRREVTVEEDARLDQCILMERTVVGRGARITRAIVDRDNHIPAGEVIGGNPSRDRRRFTVSESGICVVPQAYFPAR